MNDKHPYSSNVQRTGWPFVCMVAFYRVAYCTVAFRPGFSAASQVYKVYANIRWSSLERGRQN